MNGQKELNSNSSTNSIDSPDSRFDYGRSLRIHDHVLDNESTTHYTKKPLLHDPYQNGYKDEKHVVVRGTIIYKNTGGYLSADVKNFKKWSVLFVLLYGGLMAYWIYTIVKNQHEIVIY